MKRLGPRVLDEGGWSLPLTFFMAAAAGALCFWLGWKGALALAFLGAAGFAAEALVRRLRRKGRLGVGARDE